MAQYLANEVQAFLESDTGNAYDILVIECPPQHGKSLTLSESFPSWVMGRYPDKRIIIGSYNDETAERFARRNKEKIIAFGKTLFGVEIGRINRSTEFELDGHLGRLISRGILGGVTGNPADIMIIDDGIKNRAEADSPSYRRKLWDEWQNSFKSRLATHAKVIVIGTPWHEDDYMATMLKSEDNIRLIRLPVEAEENDPLGREVGDALCPELGKDNNWLQQFKSSYLASAEGGRRAWTALYQCSPRVEGGNLVKREWWRYYEENELPYLGTEVISVDAAFKDADNNDYVAITVWGKHENNYYLRYCLNKHLDFVGTLDAIRSVRQLYPNARTVLIEDKANGSAIINVLQKEMFCVPVNPKGGKVARVNAVSPAIESGHVYVPASAPWLGEYLDQWSAFPAGAHDDMCDSSTQALSYLLYSSGYSASLNLSKAEQVEQELLEQEKEIFLTDSVYDVYGSGGDIY
jgi:predicted phage terminase large subunit-like protein